MVRLSALRLLTFCLMDTLTAQATTYYVSGTGSDAGNGTTETTAFRTLQKAADQTNPGDQVLVMDGVYTVSHSGAVLSIKKSGTSKAWITYKKYPGHAPRIEVRGWNGIEIVGASYIEINGLEIKGNNDNVTMAQAEAQYPGPDCSVRNVVPAYNGNGIFVKANTEGSSPANPHHIKILNCRIYKCGGGGIAIQHADFLWVEGNTVHENAWYSVYANSGISVYQPFTLTGAEAVEDSPEGYRIFIRNNLSYHNASKIRWFVTCKYSDGNGIIVDDFRNTQNKSTYGIYGGRTLVANNITFGNGGSGIHAYSSNQIDIVNNVSYLNSQFPTHEDGSIFANSASDVRILNNIIVARPDKVVNTNYKLTNVVFDYNIIQGGRGMVMKGSNDVLADPLFVNPSLDPAQADFRVQENSPAVDQGVSFLAVLTDYRHAPRPQGKQVDRGAYELGNEVIIGQEDRFPKSVALTVLPNPTQEIIELLYQTPHAGTIDLLLADTTGKICLVVQREVVTGTNHLSVHTSQVPPGFYLLRLSQAGTELVRKVILTSK